MKASMMYSVSLLHSQSYTDNFQLLKSIIESVIKFYPQRGKESGSSLFHCRGENINSVVRYFDYTLCMSDFYV